MSAILYYLYHQLYTVNLRLLFRVLKLSASHHR
jgi:hypothetical protein